MAFLKMADWNRKTNLCPIDLYEIKRDIKNFSYLVKPKGERLYYGYTTLFTAETIFLNVRAKVINLIEPEENEYIFKYQDSFFLMSENLGRFDMFLTETKDSINRVLSRNLYLESKQQNKESYIVDLENYRNALILGMQSLVIMPLINSCEKFIEFRDKQQEGAKIIKVKKDVILFKYFLFLQIAHVSQVLGAKSKVSNARGKIPEMNSLPALPENVKRDEYYEDDGEKIESYKIENNDATDFFKEITDEDYYDKED